MKKVPIGWLIWLAANHFSAFGQPVDLNFPPADAIRFVGGDVKGEIGFVAKNVGDMNGDGYPELVLSSPFSDKIYIIKGQQNYPLTIDLSLTYSPYFTTVYGNLSSGFGFSVSALGDFNGDGRNDIAVGAPFEGEGGKIYILKGISPLPLKIEVTDEERFALIIEGDAGENLGLSLGDGGDIDKDYRTELPIPNPLSIIYTQDQIIFGAAHIVYGPTIDQPPFSKKVVQIHALPADINALTLYDVRTSEGSVTDFAATMNFVGDFNGDTYSDMALYVGTQRQNGKLLILPGGEKRVGTYTLEEIAFPKIQVSYNLFPAGDMHVPGVLMGDDVNRDGINEILVGLYRARLGAANQSGAVMILAGRVTDASDFMIDRPDHPEISLLGHWQVNSGFGRSLDARGSWLALGAPKAAGPAIASVSRPGALYLIDCSQLHFGTIEPQISRIAYSIWYGRHPGDGLGTSFSLVGDMNRDGVEEIFVSTPGDLRADGAVAYLLPIRRMRGDLNGDGRFSHQDIFFLTPYWYAESRLPTWNEGSSILANDILQILSSLKAP